MHAYMARAGKVPAASEGVSVITHDSREMRAGGGGYDSLSGFFIIYTLLLSGFFIIYMLLQSVIIPLH